MTTVTINILKYVSGGQWSAVGNSYNVNYQIESTDWQGASGGYFNSFTVGSLNAPPYNFTSLAAAMTYHDAAAWTQIFSDLNGNAYIPMTTFVQGTIQPSDYRTASLEASRTTDEAAIAANAAGFTRTTTNITPSLVGTGATGTQAHATKPATVRLWLSESVTSSIGGPSVAAVNIKICATNNATEASWTTLGTFEEDQTVTLAIALQSIQVMKGMIEFDLPAGYYWKAESSGSGTNSESILGGQQTVYG